MTDTNKSALNGDTIGTEFAIEGAFAFGYHGINPPPRDDHWLKRWWERGQAAAALEAENAARCAQIIDALRTQAAENADIVRKEGYQEGIADAIAVVQRLAGAV